MAHSLKRSLFATLLVLVAGAFLLPSPARAQSERAIEIKGVVNGEQDSTPDVIGQISLLDAKSKKIVKIGITYARTYDPPLVGMDIFQQAAMKPQITCFGREEELEALFGAKDGVSLKILGTYMSNEGDLIVGNVKPVE